MLKDPLPEEGGAVVTNQKEKKMARMVDLSVLFAFRFHAKFFQQYEVTERPLYVGGYGFSSIETGAEHCGIRYTPMGLEAWTAHRVEQPMLFDLVKMARTVEVVLFSQDPEKKSRVITLRVSRPRCLPLQLNASDSSVALNGVLFEGTEILSIADELREYPPLSEKDPAEEKAKEGQPGTEASDAGQ